jgi:Flp pilus assembly pilin Flp
MALFTFVQTWLRGKLHRDERGQGTTEYVLLILGVVLFLIVAALALQGVLNGAIDKISTWISSQNAP